MFNRKLGQHFIVGHYGIQHFSEFIILLNNPKTILHIAKCSIIRLKNYVKITI